MSVRKSDSKFTQALIFLYFYQDNIFSDLADTFPGNTEFAVPSKASAESGGSGDNQFCDLAALGIKFHIHRTAHAFAGAGIDDFFLFQFKDTHGKILFVTVQPAGYSRCEVRRA